MLYLVATPIGNLKDLTFRAKEMLDEVDLILAEDTRNSQKLLAHYSITTPLRSFHAHNEHNKLDQYITLLKEGHKIALISDAGTPGISDPGFLIVRACIGEDIPVTCLPGPCALIPAVVASGIPCDRFYFEGFLPQKKGRKTRLEFLIALPETFIMYESPYRVLKTLQQLKELGLGDRRVAVVKEISKLYETYYRGTIEDVEAQINKLGKLKGEYIIVVEGQKKSSNS